MTHDQIIQEANNILSAPYVTNIYRYHTILCINLEVKYRAGGHLSDDERHEVLEILFEQIKKQYDKLEK